jgi:hypothetical protein
MQTPPKFLSAALSTDITKNEKRLSVNFVCLMRKTAVLVPCETTEYKLWELPTIYQHSIISRPAVVGVYVEEYTSPGISSTL